MPKLPVVIVGVLQNQWFNDPVRAKHTMEEIYIKRFGKKRHDFIGDMLFFGCLTGKRLREAFGESMCEKIIWENISPKFGGHSSACFDPDPEHITSFLDEHHPTVLLTFGRVAEEGIKGLVKPHVIVINLPHPAARGNDVMSRLKAGAERLKKHA